MRHVTNTTHLLSRLAVVALFVILLIRLIYFVIRFASRPKKDERRP